MFSRASLVSRMATAESSEQLAFEFKDLHWCVVLYCYPGLPHRIYMNIHSQFKQPQHGLQRVH